MADADSKAGLYLGFALAREIVSNLAVAMDRLVVEIEPELRETGMLHINRDRADTMRHVAKTLGAVSNTVATAHTIPADVRAELESVAVSQGKQVGDELTLGRVLLEGMRRR